MEKLLNVVDLWIAQKEVDKMREKLEEAQERLQALVKASTTEELILFMESYYEASERLGVADTSESFIYVTHELADREDKELDIQEEEAPQ